MKKELPKIAIKYDEENWPNIKKAVDYLRSKGQSVIQRKRDFNILDYSAEFLSNGCLAGNGLWDDCDWEYGIDIDLFKDEGFRILTMPQEFDKLKSYFENEPKLEKGKWYQCTTAVALYLGENIGCGFVTLNDNWQELTMNITELWQPADMTKVKELLIKEAERRGVCLKCSVNGWNILKLEYEIINGRFFVDGILLFTFSNGKWEDIISPKSYEELEKENKELKEKLDEISDILKKVVYCSREVFS